MQQVSFNLVQRGSCRGVGYDKNSTDGKSQQTQLTYTNTRVYIRYKSISDDKFLGVKVRSLALPFTVMEWALPPAPKAAAAAANSWAKKSSMMKERPTIASAVAAANAPPSNPGAGNLYYVVTVIRCLSRVCTCLCLRCYFRRSREYIKKNHGLMMHKLIDAVYLISF